MIDKHIESAASAAFLQSGQQAYDTIVSLLDRKHDLQCLLLLRDSMLCKCDDKQLVLVQVIQGEIDKDNACKQLNIRPNVLAKLIDKLYTKLVSHCVEIGYNYNYFGKRYAKIGFLQNNYNKLSKAA
jgi:hypothetical protein